MSRLLLRLFEFKVSTFGYVGVTLSRTWHQMDTRLWKCSNSGLIVYTSGHSWGHLKPSYDHRLSFSGFGNNFVSDGKIFGMPKKCPKTLRRFIIVLNSCVRFALRKAIVWASWQIVSSSSLPRVIIGAIWPFSPHEDNTMETRSFPIVLARQHDYVKPSQCRRVSTVYPSYYTSRLDKAVGEGNRIIRIWGAQAFHLRI